MRRPELKIKRARGFLLIVAIMVLVVIALAIAALGNMTSADIRSSAGHAQSEQAYFAATSGIEHASFQFGPGTACNSGSIDNLTASVGQARFTTTTQTFLASTSTIDSPLSASATTVNVVSTASFASHGRIWIDGEQMNYSGKTATAFTGLIRGLAGSTATTHVLGSTVSQDQCLVKSTGASANATRVLEAAIARSTNRERAMLVYAKGTALTGGGFDRNIYYRLWDPVNTVWSAERTSTLQVANNASPIYFIVRFARTRNEAVLGTIDGAGNMYIHVWDGDTDTWSNPLGATTALQTGMSNTNRDFHIAYEYQNDRAMIVYSNGGAANPKFAIWNGATLNTTPAAGGFIHSSLGLATYVTPNVIRWFRLAANQDSSSNEILMLTFDSGNQVWGARWNGSAWVKMEAGVASAWDTSAGNSTDQEAVEVVYQSKSNIGMFVWGDASANKQFQWRTWTPSTSALGAIGTTAITNFSGGGTCANNSLIEWLRVYPRPDTDEIMMILQLSGRDVASIRWDGSAWDNANRTCHDPNTETANERDFDFSWQTLPSGLGKAWLVWGSRTAVGGLYLATQSFASPASPGPGGAWSAATRVLNRTLGVKMAVLPLAGTTLAVLYQSTSSPTDDIQGIYAVGGAAPPPWTIPGWVSIWGGPTTLQQGERTYIGVSPTTSLILQQQELYQ